MTFDIRHKGFRYWATLERHPYTGQIWWRFWSSHKWPFFHGSYMQKTVNREDAWQHFIGWLPFDYKEKTYE